MEALSGGDRKARGYRTELDSIGRGDAPMSSIEDAYDRDYEAINTRCQAMALAAHMPALVCATSNGMRLLTY